jgi:hypothetical protein
MSHPICPQSTAGRCQRLRVSDWPNGNGRPWGGGLRTGRAHRQDNGPSDQPEAFELASGDDRKCGSQTEADRTLGYSAGILARGAAGILGLPHQRLTVIATTSAVR